MFNSPDFELRTAILLIKAKKYDVFLSIENAKLIAEKAQDARGLEGLLLRVITQAQAGDGEITEDLISAVLSLNKEEKINGFHPDEIIQNVCYFYKVKPTQLKSPKRDAFLVKPRQVAMYLLKKELGLTFVEIGNLLGGRDHTTIMHGVGKVENMLKKSLISEDIMGISKIRWLKTMWNTKLLFLSTVYPLFYQQFIHLFLRIASCFFPLFHINYNNYK